MSLQAEGYCFNKLADTDLTVGACKGYCFNKLADTDLTVSAYRLKVTVLAS